MFTFYKMVAILLKQVKYTPRTIAAAVNVFVSLISQQQHQLFLISSWIDNDPNFVVMNIKCKVKMISSTSSCVVFFAHSLSLSVSHRQSANQYSSRLLIFSFFVYISCYFYFLHNISRQESQILIKELIKEMTYE